MDIVLVSDTHNAHAGVEVPSCDLLVHAGDWSRFGTEEETLSFFAWFGVQPARVRVLTPGNHDLYAEREPERMRALAREHDIHWLIDEPLEPLGLKLWASPYTPRHGAWAFQDDRGASLKKRWDAIPAGLDLLITHGPPHGVGDRIAGGEHVGCEALLDAVRARPPRVHVFGHVHEDHGEGAVDGVRTRFINASSFISTSVRRARSDAVRPPWQLTL